MPTGKENILSEIIEEVFLQEIISYDVWTRLFVLPANSWVNYPDMAY